MGSWGTGAKEFLSDIGNRVRHATGNPRAMEFFRQRVSIEIQCGNAATVMGTVESCGIAYFCCVKPVIFVVYSYPPRFV